MIQHAASLRCVVPLQHRSNANRKYAKLAQLEHTSAYEPDMSLAPQLMAVIMALHEINLGVAYSDDTSRKRVRSSKQISSSRKKFLVLKASSPRVQ